MIMFKPCHVVIGSLVLIWVGCLWIVGETLSFLVYGIRDLAILGILLSLALLLIATFLTILVVRERKSSSMQAKTWQEYWEGK